MSHRTRRLPNQIVRRSPLAAAAAAAAAAAIGVVLVGGAHVMAGSTTFSIDVPRVADQAHLVQAVRVDPPDAITTTGQQPPAASQAPVPAINVSTCRTELGPAAFTITMPSLSYACPVYAGGQATLNSGAVTSISDPALASVLSTGPGGAGTLWIAAHRKAHGGAFAAVPTLADGDLVIISDAATTSTYRVVGRAYFALRRQGRPSCGRHGRGNRSRHSTVDPAT